MNTDEHAKRLGGLLMNFQSLEFILRVFLQGLPSARPLGIPNGTDIYSFPVGAELPESELTSYDALGELIKKFNAEMNTRGLSGIDHKLVEVRDALAHGRVSAASLADDLRLLKFGRPKNGRVRVVFNERLTEAWFNTQTKHVCETILFVERNTKP